jgi:hypothetical protein
VSEDLGTLKKICAWCKRFIGGNPDSEILSHGICPECEKRVFRNEKGEIV